MSPRQTSPSLQLPPDLHAPPKQPVSPALQPTWTALPLRSPQTLKETPLISTLSQVRPSVQSESPLQGATMHPASPTLQLLTSEHAGSVRASVTAQKINHSCFVMSVRSPELQNRNRQV